MLSFDLNEILLETEQGMLMVKGANLHVNRLSLEKGEVDISGGIDSLAYSDVQGHGKAQENYSQNSSGDKMPQIQVEIMIFFSAVLSGAGLRAVYRGIGCVREWIPHRAAVIELEDLLYWLAAALYLFVQIYHTSNGSIRWYLY